MNIVGSSNSSVCTGICKGDRGAADVPARPGHLGDGTKVLWCPCCTGQLRRVAVDDPGHPPNLVLDARATPVRWTDDTCGYDVVILSNLR